MSFLDNLSRSKNTSYDAGLMAAVTGLTLDGDLIDVERRAIGLFRDQFSPLSALDEDVFQQALDRAITAVSQKNPATDLAGFVRAEIVTAVTNPKDRLELYQFIYALAMADLNVSEGETELLKQLQSQFGLKPADCSAVEQSVLKEFRVLHEALASTVLGLIVVTADGKVQPEELEDVRAGRSILDTVAKLDDTQFSLIFDLSLNIHDRFLLDAENRHAFLQNILGSLLTSQKVRIAAFSYAAHIATSDGDLTTAEIDVLKDLLQTMQISDADGERLFNQYMTRVRTIDGKPR